MAFEILVIFFGLLSVIGVLAAQAEGAGLKADAGHAARQGLIVAGLIGLPLTIVIANLDMLLAATGQDPDVVALAGALSVCAQLFRSARAVVHGAQRFCGGPFAHHLGHGDHRLPVAVNWALTEGLVHGRWGLPEMGIAGAGASTAIVHWLMLARAGDHDLSDAVAAGLWPLSQPAARRSQGDGGVLSPRLSHRRFGGGGGGAVHGGRAPLRRHWGGDISGASGADGWIGIPFMIAMALAEGSMVRVAYNIGAGSPVGARHAGLVAMAVGGAILSALVAAPLLLAEDFTRIFLAADQDGFDEVAAVVVQLMAIAAAFQVFDGVQAIASRSLRGLKDALAPFLIGAFGYWVVGIGLGWVLAFPLDWRGPGLWTGLAVGLFVAAILLTLRFLTKTRALIAAARQSGP